MAELVWEYFFFEIASLHLKRQILQNELLRVLLIKIEKKDGRHKEHK